MTVIVLAMLRVSHGSLLRRIWSRLVLIMNMEQGELVETVHNGDEVNAGPLVLIVDSFDDRFM